jgi:maltooligosyltrehalose trehalohydrolase
LYDGRRIPATQSAYGWWTSPTAIDPGVDYSCFIDGKGPFPDPRSAAQPRGVHGPSNVVDHNAFRWNDDSWQAPPMETGVIYELHIGTFTPPGTFMSTIDRLDFLKGLGITHMELMPVAEFAGDYGWGYDGVDLYAPHHAYGRPDDLKALVDACHKRGLAIILDVVYNHFGPSGNYWDNFGPYLTHRYATPWGDAVNLDDRGSNEVRRHFCDNALMWLRDYHFDGLRLDAVHAMFDRSAVHFLEQLGQEVKTLGDELGRRFILIAESDLNDPRLIRSHEAGGFALDAQWSDDFHHALHSLLTTEHQGYYQDFGSFADLATALSQGFVYDGRYSVYRDRRHGRAPTGLSGHHFVCCTQNHDQVGNRARGDRLAHLVSPGRLKIAAALLLTSPFIPLLFQGEEWAASAPFQYFTSHSDPDLADAISEGRKKEFVEFGWDPTEIPDPQAPETFSRCKLDWSEVAIEPHRNILNWYRDLITLRRRYPMLTNGHMNEVKTVFDQSNYWFAMLRSPLAVIFNLSAHRRSLVLPDGVSDNLLMGSDPTVLVRDQFLELPPDSVAILAPPEAVDEKLRLI